MTHNPTPHPFRFTGNGGEYFRIWIVNLCLSLLTLGIYSAWAKVRRLQYFYRHTSVAGASLDYHGDPVAILKGRIIAVGLFAIYSLAGKFSLIYGAAAFVLILVVMPWLLVRSFRFRLHNTSYRGLRFAFHGKVGDARGTLVMFMTWWAPITSLFMDGTWEIVYASGGLSRLRGTGTWLSLVDDTNTPISAATYTGSLWRE